MFERRSRRGPSQLARRRRRRLFSLAALLAVAGLAVWLAIGGGTSQRPATPPTSRPVDARNTGPGRLWTGGQCLPKALSDRLLPRCRIRPQLRSVQAYCCSGDSLRRTHRPRRCYGCADRKPCRSRHSRPESMTRLRSRSTVRCTCSAAGHRRTRRRRRSTASCLRARSRSQGACRRQLRPVGRRDRRHRLRGRRLHRDALARHDRRLAARRAGAGRRAASRSRFATRRWRRPAGRARDRRRLARERHRELERCYEFTAGQRRVGPDRLAARADDARRGGGARAARLRDRRPRRDVWTRRRAGSSPSTRSRQDPAAGLASRAARSDLAAVSLGIAHPARGRPGRRRRRSRR